MHNSRIKQISLAVCLALIPFAANAAGLGKMTVMSGLGEPLSAEIELSAGKDELVSLSATIATAETYAEQGVERSSSMNAIRVELASKPNGSPVLKLSTPQPVDDPFLDMLIQVDWPTGRLLREYTALLDPPGYGDSASTLADTSPASEVVPAVTVPSKKNASKRPSPIAKATSPEAVRPEAGAPKNYVTQSGDTLRSVARKMQVDDVSLEQMLVGLFRANRNAFIGDNMNQLKVGQIMRAPQGNELRSVSQQEALQEIRLHASNWNSYRGKLADAVAQSAPDQSEARQVVSGKIATSAEDKASAPVSGPRDVVKLSKSDVGELKPETAGSGKGKVAEDKFRALEEESTAQEKAIKDANERIAFFEKQIQDMQKLLLVQNQILADLQKGKPVQQPTTAEPQPSAIESRKSEELQSQQAVTPPSAIAEQPREVASKAKSPMEAAPEMGIFDSLGDDALLLGGVGGGLLVLLGGAWLYLRGRQRKGLDGFEQGILAGGELKPASILETASGNVAAKETSPLGDLSQHSGGGIIDTHDVDPISEAEVYMAYGRDAQAEEILKDAIAKEPRRYELHHKLLEIYAKSKNVAAFETLAGELYSTLGPTDPNWLKVVELGQALEPDNPLYTTGSRVSRMASFPAQDNSLEPEVGVTAVAEPTGEFEPETTAEAPASSESLPEVDFSNLAAAESEIVAEVKADKDAMAPGAQIDLPEPPVAENVQLDAADLGLPVDEPAEAAPQEPPALDAGLEFSSFDQESPVVPDASVAQAEEVANDLASSQDEGLDFSLERDLAAEMEKPSTSALLPELDLSSISLNLDVAEKNEVQPEEEIVLSGSESPDVDTKLDLVTAYMDMGDSDGARELLDEVLKEGSPSQRARAQKLLDSLQ